MPKDTAKLIIIIDKLKLEIDITHARMKKQVNLLKEQALKQNSNEERQNILLSIEKLKKEKRIGNAQQSYTRENTTIIKNNDVIDYFFELHYNYVC
jgi:hypothetical protein